MHIFLQGTRDIGKSTVIRNTLDLLTALKPLKIGGFMTWRTKKRDQHIIYIKPVMSGREHEKYHLADYFPQEHSFNCDPRIFDQIGVRLLKESTNADLIVMDELGFLERNSFAFQQAVLNTLAGDIPVIGALRTGNIPWHEPIKTDLRVSLLETTLENRDTMPQEIASQLTPSIKS